MNALSSPLGRRAPTEPLSPEELDRFRERAWQEKGLIPLYPDEIADEWIRQAVVNVVTAKFGKRMKR